MAYDSIDGSHPNNMGMTTIATMIIRSVAEFDADRFLDCEYGQHEYKVAEEYTGITRYVCSRCGKIMKVICRILKLQTTIKRRRLR